MTISDSVMKSFRTSNHDCSKWTRSYIDNSIITEQIVVDGQGAELHLIDPKLEDFSKDRVEVINGGRIFVKDTLTSKNQLIDPETFFIRNKPRFDYTRVTKEEPSSEVKGVLFSENDSFLIRFNQVSVWERPIRYSSDVGIKFNTINGPPSFVFFAGNNDKGNTVNGFKYSENHEVKRFPFSYRAYYESDYSNDYCLKGNLALREEDEVVMTGICYELMWQKDMDFIPEQYRNAIKTTAENCFERFASDRCQ